jgi:hypothetical protein
MAIAIGQKYGKLTVIAALKEISPFLWRFKCDCGLLTVLPSPPVEKGVVKCCAECQKVTP